MTCSFKAKFYQNIKNGFSVCQYSTKDESVPLEARDKRAPEGIIYFTATGYWLPDTDILDYDLDGVWAKNDRFGPQLEVKYFSEIVPKTKKGMIAYLGSGLIKGIGPKTAQVIVDAYGARTMDVMENDPERLLSIRGISTERLEKIKNSLAESRSMREIVSYLAPYGVSVKEAAKILKHFGGESIRTLKTQPFRLCAISGFGFKTVDQIARKTFCPLTDPLRIRGGLTYLLDEAAVSGHLFLPELELEEKAHVLLNEELEDEIISPGMVHNELERMLKEGLLQSDIARVYKPEFRKAEIIAARKVLQMLGTPSDLEIDIEKELTVSQKKLGVKLAGKQCDAVRMCFTNTFSIMTGGPGTGKTTTLRVILDICERVLPDNEILLAAPTGRASRRMVETTGFPTASTLHKALGISAGHDYDFDEVKPELDTDFVVVDEVSMIDMLLAAALFHRLKRDTRLLFVGDPDQLPSVGPGNVLRELLRCGIIPYTHLDTIYRQKAGSRIALNAHAINNGNKNSLVYGDDFVFLKAEDSEEAARIVLETYMLEVDKYGVENVQILAPFKSRGEVCVQKINEKGRELINPPSAAKSERQFGFRIFRSGDKVIQTKNRDEVSNGDIGFIDRIYQKDDDAYLDVGFGGPVILYQEDEVDQLDLAYATTIHKSQGSEYTSVIIPLLKEHWIMLRRNLVYTAITRAKEKITLVGQKQALYMAISKNDIDVRNTLLADRIVSYYRKMQSVKPPSRVAATG